MKTAAIYLLALLSACNTPPTVSTETVVTFKSAGQDVVATLAVPPGDASPVVLMLHGFTGARDELKTTAVPNGVFAYTAAKLAAAGFSSLRIDFRGSGESISAMGFADTTFEGQVVDALAAIEFLRSDERVQAEQMFLIGWSQGGLVATASAGRSNAFRSVALWAAVADPVATFELILGQQTMAAGKAAEPAQPIQAALPWDETVELKGAFFDGILNFSPPTEIAEYTGPLLIAQGKQDTIVLPSSAQILSEAHRGPQTVLMLEMDHAFNTFSTSTDLDELIGSTIAFFEGDSAQ